MEFARSNMTSIVISKTIKRSGQMYAGKDKEDVNFVRLDTYRKSEFVGAFLVCQRNIHSEIKST